MYAGGYVSAICQMTRHHPMAVVVTRDGRRLVLPVADTAPAIEAGIDESEIVGFGKFYFESASGALPSQLADRFDSLGQALAHALNELGISTGSVGIDVGGLATFASQALAALPDWTAVVDATTWLAEVRSRKTSEEIEALQRAAALAVRGVDRAVESARPGTTEHELARIVAATMVEGDAMPRFVVATSGPRSALADAFATSRPIERGDLVRFDVGCLLEGYWSDIGRTAVVGPPSSKQSEYYAALLAGEQAQLDAVRPGMTAHDLFEIAMSTVKDRGIPNYRRQHCGHGIGAEMYEQPIIAHGNDGKIDAGMTFCFETPYYELGWGGMMVEDTVVVTETGCESFTDTDRSLREIAL